MRVLKCMEDPVFLSGWRAKKSKIVIGVRVEIFEWLYLMITIYGLDEVGFLVIG